MLRLVKNIPYLALLLFVQSVSAGDLHVVVNEKSDIGNLDKKSIADLYMGKNKKLSHLQPIDQEDKALREKFYKDVTGMSLTRVRAYWAKMVFTGKGRPPRQLSQEEALKLVATDNNSMTYIQGQEDIVDVKTIYQSE